MKKKILVLLSIIVSLVSCSPKVVDETEIQSLQNKCEEYEAQIEKLQKENNALRSECDSLTAIVEDVKKWLYNK